MEINNLDFEIRFYEKLIGERPNYVDALIPLAEAYTRKGSIREGLEIDKRLSLLCPLDPVVHYNLACSLALAKDKEHAVHMLHKAVVLGYSDLDHLKKDPDLQALHGHPDFEELIRFFPQEA